MRLTVLALAACLLFSDGVRLYSEPRCVSCARDSRGRIRRDPYQRRLFMVMSGHPHGWPGHVIDHVIPLCLGGPDKVSNMAWQSIEEAKAKDKIERRDCARRERGN